MIISPKDLSELVQFKKTIPEYNFLKKISGDFAIQIFRHGVTKTKNSSKTLCRWLFENIPNDTYLSRGGYVSQQKDFLTYILLCHFWTTDFFPSRRNENSDFEHGVIYECWMKKILIKPVGMIKNK